MKNNNLDGYYTVELIQDYNEGKFGGHNVWYNENEVREKCLDKKEFIEKLNKFIACVEYGRPDLIKHITRIFGDLIEK